MTVESDLSYSNDKVKPNLSSSVSPSSSQPPLPSRASQSLLSSMVDPYSSNSTRSSMTNLTSPSQMQMSYGNPSYYFPRSSYYNSYSPYNNNYFNNNSLGGLPSQPLFSFSEQLDHSTRSIFNLLESMVQAVYGFAQMIDGTYYAGYTSIYALIGFFKQFKKWNVSFHDKLENIFNWIRSKIWLVFFASKKFLMIDGGRNLMKELNGMNNKNGHNDNFDPSITKTNTKGSTPLQQSYTSLSSSTSSSSHYHHRIFNLILSLLLIYGFFTGSFKLIQLLLKKFFPNLVTQIDQLNTEDSITNDNVSDKMIILNHPVFAQALFDFNGSELTDLPLTQGELVAIIKVPCSYVLFPSKESWDRSDTYPSHISSYPSAPNNIYTYHTADDRIETCQESHLNIDLLDKMPTWLYGRLKHGKMGYFPSNYIKLLSPIP